MIYSGVAGAFPWLENDFSEGGLGEFEEMSPPAQLWRVYRVLHESGGEALTCCMEGW